MRTTLRLRLTVIYGGLFLLAGAVLLTLTVAVVGPRLPQPANCVIRVDGPGPTEGACLQELPPQLLPGPGEQLKIRTTAGDALTPSEFKSTAMQELITTGAISLLVVTLVAVALAWLIAGRALQPLHNITATAARIGGAPETGPRGLHERIGYTGRDTEVRQLADTFDAMLERLDRSFDGQQRFVANASHELRTPLAINRALIEVAVTRPGASDDVKQLGEGLLTVNARHERLIDGLLTLAGSEMSPADHTDVDLADVAEHVLAQSARAAADAGVTVEEPVLAPAPAIGDPVLLERLAGNLVENAIRHNVPGGTLRVTTGRDGGAVVLTVTNTGPVVPRYDVPAMFQPFRRLGGERAAGPERGFGLGLSIVRAVARAHGGDVTAVPRDGGGLVVTVRLPDA